MTSILTDWGKRCIEKLIKGVIAEARFVFCLSCIANEFDEERAKLEPQRKTLEQRVQEAKGRNKNIAANVVSWEEEVVKLFQEDTKTKQNCFFGFCPDCIWRYERGKQLANDTEKIKGLIEKAEKFGNIEVSRPPPGVEHKSSQDYISFESRLSKYNELLDALKDDNNYITGLQGMGGTGKTTLAIKVGKELKESGQFTYVIDTTVSFTPDIKKIQDDIAGPLGLKWEDCNESDRPGKLWDTLTKGEKILLILDDVWDEDPLDFDAIGIPTRGNHKGCRVLVTTRSKQLSNNMNFDKSIELELLSDEDVWTMFKRYANISESSSKDVKKKGREIAKECKKLPVLIAVIASSLRGHHDRMEKWDATLTSLKKPVTLDGVEADLVGVFNRLKVSYDNMNDEKAKGLFRLCSVFPEDEEISVEVLTRLCIGAGLFGEDYESYNDARNQVVVAKNKLLDYCLLLEVEEKFVKMHDLIRDVARWIARKESRGVNLSIKDQTSLIEKETNIKCLLFEGSYKDLFFCKFDGSKLETLIAREDIDKDCNVERDEDIDEDCNVDRDEDCNMDKDEDCHREIPNSFFENIVKLRVLYLSCYGNRSLSLTNSFQSLKNIRSMMVQKVDLGDISVLGKLQRLEALELVKCKIHELPIEIEKLENLKLLRLESCEIGKGNPFEVIKKCSSLEELYFIDSFNDFCREITLPPKLRRYHIGVGTWGKEMYLSHSKCVVLNKKVYGYFTKGTLEYFMQTAEAIELIRINSGWKNLMPEMVPIKNGMNELVQLHLRFDSELQCLIDTKHIDSQVPIVVFSKLVVLKLEDMEKLEELCNSPISLDCLNNLKEVTIDNCNHLQSLFKCSLNLKKLKIWSCSTLISVFDLTSSQSLLQLEILDIYSCEQLENIFTYDGDNDNSKSCNSMFPNLKVLHIVGCDQLQFILPCHSAGDLLSLESIKIAECDKLTQLIKHPWDDTIEEKVNGDNDKNSSCNSIMFPNLKKVYVYGCPQLEFVLPLQSAQDLLLLESIIIGSCDKLEYIFGQHQDIQLPSLKKLKLNDVPNFIDIFPESSHSMPSSIKRSSNSISKTQTQLETIKSNIFSWSHICCHGCKLKGPTISLDHLRERAQCLSRLSHIMSNIKKLVLVNLSKIKSVFVLSTSRMMLESFTIENCDELKHIIVDIGGSSGSDNTVFPNLKELKVKNCGKLEYIFGQIDDSDDNQNHNLHLPALKCLKLCSLPSLTGVCTKNYRTTFPHLEEVELNDCSQLDIVKDHFCNIKELMLVNLSKIKSVFVLSITSRIMLESLTIENCDELKHIIVDIGDSSGSDNSVFPKLKELEVKNCGKLEYIFGNIDASDDHQNHNLHLPALKYLKLSSLPSLTGMCTKNYQTTFPHLAELELGDCSQLDIVKDHLWERAQCLSRLSHIMCNIKEITLENLSKIKSVFILSSASRMLLESMTIRNCDELKHILVDIGDSSGSDNTVFPKLKELEVNNCGKLEYLFGNIDASDDHQNQNLHLPALKFLKLCSLPSLTGVCTKNYRTTFPPLAELELGDCTQDDIKSIGDFIVKELSGNMEHFAALESLKLDNSKVESICRLNEASERQMNMGLQNIELHNQPMMTCLFVGLTNSFDLKNLAMIKIMGCEKLEIIFSTSIIMCLPQLLHIRVEGCKELKHMIEDDLENRKTVCFPKLRTLFVQKCNMLKNVFPISISKELPELAALMIREADNLEEIFVCEGDQKVNIPNIKLVEFVNLPSLCQTQRIHFQAVPHCLVQNCQEIYLNPASPKGIDIFDLFYKSRADYYFYMDMESVISEIQRKIRDRDTWNENPSSKTIKATAAAGIEVQVASEHMLTSSQELMNQQHLHGEIDTSIKPSHGNNNLEGSTSENLVVESLFTISGTKDGPPIQVVDTKQKGIEITGEEGTTLKSSTPSSSDLLATSKHITTSQDQNIQEGSTSGTKNDQDIQLVTLKQKSIKSCFEDDDHGDSKDTNQTINYQVSLSPNIKEQFPMDDEIISKSKPSPSIISPIAYQFPLIPSKDFDLYLHMESLYRQFQEVSKGHSNGNENQSAQITKEFAAWIEAEAASRHELTSSQLEGSTTERLAGSTLSTISETINEQPIQLVAPTQKGNEIGFEEGTTSTCDKTITSATHLEVVDIKLPATNYVDIGDFQETIVMEDINKLIEEDPLLALEKLLTGVQSYSIETLLQELKTLMESLSDLDHLVTNQESKEKLFSLFHGLNQHQGLLPSYVKEYVEKVQIFFNDNISKHATSQEVLKKHNQLLDSKTDLMNKLLSAKSTQTHIDNETSSAIAQKHEISLQIDELRKKLADLENQRDDLNSVVNQCDVQKKKLKAECSKWAQQSKELLSALALSEVNAKEAERARTLAKEGFANLKSSFPKF